MSDGMATEAFVLNEKGKVLAHVLLISFGESLLISGVGDQAETLVEHLNRYIIREDVLIADKSAETISVFVCGDNADNKMLAILRRILDSGMAVRQKLGNAACVIVNAEVAGGGYLWLIESPQFGEVENIWQGHEVPPCTLEALEIVRIESGTPWFGREISQSNLPQEIDRDSKAISFTKGCYLGQETVARIDARGHVNRLLRRLSINSDCVPDAGAQIFDGEDLVGTVMSAAQRPMLPVCTAMAYLKRSACDPGRRLRVNECDAVVF